MSIFIPPKPPEFHTFDNYRMMSYQPLVEMRPPLSLLADIGYTDIEIPYRILRKIMEDKVHPGMKINRAAKYNSFDKDDGIEYTLNQYTQMPRIKYSSAWNCTAAYNEWADIIFMHYWYEYEDKLHYYTCLIHELIHSTGHVRRLNRMERKDCLIEELVCAIGTAIILYNAMRDDEDRIFSISARAVFITGTEAKVSGTELIKAIDIAIQPAIEAVSYIRKGGKDNENRKDTE